MLAAASLVAAVAAAAVAVQPPPPRTNTDRLAMLDQAARKPLRVHANSQRRARGPSALKASVADRILFFLRACSKKIQRRKKSILPRATLLDFSQRVVWERCLYSFFLCYV
jgi:hypothetical protein